MEDLLKTIEVMLVGKKFKDTKLARDYYFHPTNGLVGEGANVVMANRNLNLGSGIVPIYLKYEEGKASIYLDKVYNVDSVTIPFSEGSIELRLSHSDGDSLHLQEVK